LLFFDDFFDDFEVPELIQDGCGDLLGGREREGSGETVGAKVSTVG
jgi:hypothetical protein